MLIRDSSLRGLVAVVRPGEAGDGAHGKAERSEPDQGLAVPATVACHRDANNERTSNRNRRPLCNEPVQRHSELRGRSSVGPVPVTSTTRNGWFAAWWPRTHATDSAQITTDAGTTTEQLNIPAVPPATTDPAKPGVRRSLAGTINTGRTSGAVVRVSGQSALARTQPRERRTPRASRTRPPGLPRPIAAWMQRRRRRGRARARRSWQFVDGCEPRSCGADSLVRGHGSEASRDRLCGWVQPVLRVPAGDAIPVD